MKTILVTGATGTIGRHVVPALAHHGHRPLAFGRDPQRLAATHPGIQARVGDFGDPETLRAAMTGVDSVFLASPNTPDQVQHECAVIDAAAACGVRRIVKLSARGADETSPVAFWQWHAAIESHLKRSGVPYVALRPGFSMANVLGHADQVRDHDILPAPALATPVAMVHPADVAEVAAHLLATDPFPTERVLELTGPQAVTFTQLAELLTDVAARPIAYAGGTDDQVRQSLDQRGVPAFVTDQILAIFDQLRTGAQAATTSAVTDVLGRPGRPVGAFLAENAAAFKPARQTRSAS